jgi:hypothetical protein
MKKEIAIGRFIIELSCEWLQLFGKYNWFSFTPFLLRFEYEKWLEGLTLELTVLGFGIYIRYNLPASDEIYERLSTDI